MRKIVNKLILLLNVHCFCLVVKYNIIKLVIWSEPLSLTTKLYEGGR